MLPADFPEGSYFFVGKWEQGVSAKHHSATTDHFRQLATTNIAPRVLRSAEMKAEGLSSTTAPCMY